MGKFDEYYSARKKILEIVTEDLRGPVEKNEVINEAPTSFYIMGKLYPRTSDELEKDDNTTSVDIECTETDSALTSANAKEPSAMGLTYTVCSGIKELDVNVVYAVYKPFSYEEAKKAELDLEKYSELINDADDKALKKMCFWSRNEVRKTLKVPTSENYSEELEEDFFFKSFLHMETQTGERVITSVLTNERTVDASNKDKVAEASIFQPEIEICSNDGKATFTEVCRQVEMLNNEELIQLEMLYLKDKCYAQGHGCSVVWDMENDTPSYIKTSFVPDFNLNQMKAAEITNNPVFKMHYLFSAEREEIIGNLYRFADEYKNWIDSEKEQSKSAIYENYSQSADENINKCEAVLARIRRSIETLSENDTSWKSFVLANEAMYMQRCKTIEKEAASNGVEPVIDDEKIAWYPFQLAFILLEITSFTDPEGDDRKIVDLLWFPTGGGKTEAYLGIAAFAIFYRRLKYSECCDGITIIMRYTLRLLTIQQFERASMLMCACEIIRKRDEIPGDEITIGLWVGNNFTPGTLEGADRALTKISAIGQLSGEETNPCQVKICPWCGKKLYPANYHISARNKRMEIICKNDECDFYNLPLPVRLVDEEIYEYKPTFLVATVDKFAQIAIQEKVSELFSVNNRSLPPELIIQDELHLISGPLGTMTGIYEAAITSICDKKGRPVKVVASTATIRNASKQILSLYGREYCQFPPQGLTADDSFFAIKANEDERPARLYVGIMGVGTTFTTTIIRLYAAWLFASRYLIDLGYDEKVIDNYWTMTGYFNSIRELGATQTQIVDDIQSRYKYLKNNKLKHKYSNYTGEDFYENSEELTSRMSNDDISEIIQKKLKVPYKKDDHSEVYDFILASNMISVGVDVSRLGVMAVAGQSKTNAEYIQATSRVGRTNPGIVFTVYNAGRSRDRSHYEQFSRYHSALYRYVEATSLTPFSDRARDRGLQALFVTLCRYYCPKLMPDNAAGNFSPDLPEVKEVERLIYSYVNIVDEREREKVLAELKDIEKKWYDATAVGELWYRNNKKPSLLKPDTEEDRFRIMNSMRTVEQESGIYLIGVYE